MSEYYEVYKQRLSADGFSYKEQIQNLARKNFDRYLAETPTAVTVKYEGESYRVAIVENKQDEFRLSKQMLSSIYDYIPIGGLVYWEYFNPKDCPENFWIVWKRQQNSIQDHNVSYISRCNHKLKWIDDYGVRHEQYVYEFSSKENMIRATFKSRVQEIIASEPNKFMEIIMPFTKDIKREQRFIVDGEAWYVIEFDSSSVDGITYITLGEDRKDLQQDLLIDKGDIEDLANYEKENSCYIEIINTNPVLNSEGLYNICPFYYENGILQNKEFNFYINNVLIQNGTEFLNYYNKDTEIKIKLIDNEQIQKKISLRIDEDAELENHYMLVGSNSIKWGKTSEYYVIGEINGNVDIINNVNYSISNDSLISYQNDENKISITANNKRKMGDIVLTASNENFSIEKRIKITSLW